MRDLKDQNDGIEVMPFEKSKASQEFKASELDEDDDLDCDVQEFEDDDQNRGKLKTSAMMKANRIAELD